MDLIEGTIASISRVGFHKSTVQTICEEAGLSRGIIGHYFRGKEDLLLAAFRHLADRLSRQTVCALRGVARDPFKRLVVVATLTFHEDVVSNEHAPVWLAFWGVALWEPEMLDVHRDLWGGYRQWIERMIARAAEERGLEIDARLAAITYTQLIDGLWMGWVMEGRYSLEDCRSVLRNWLFDLFGEAPENHRDVDYASVRFDRARE